MMRTRHRFQHATIVPDTGLDAEPVLFVMECQSCGFFGPKTEEAEDGTEWALKHFKENPGHVRYREHVTRPYRVDRGGWQ